MCGICGIVERDGDPTVRRRLLAQMNASLRHRGPDDEGQFHDGVAGLAMRRLSIIDLAGGHQPLGNEDGSLQLVFNGEIYNFRQLRARLEAAGHHFATASDSEVILHAYEEFGPDCVNYFNGMFAFAIWDCRARTLFLARDRLGIKPLFVWHDDRTLVFGSELTAVAHHPRIARRLDPLALDQYLTFEYVTAPRTMLDGVEKLPAGHWLRWRDGVVEQHAYWEPAPADVPADPAACVAALRELIADAVRLRLVSDVPLGAFLSGGLDSSAIVHGMHTAAPSQLRTFSVGFRDASYNELPYARAVAQRFGTRHFEELLPLDVDAILDEVVGHIDEPLADFSVFSTYLVSAMARRHVAVALSGDGGDELFGGYDTYVAERLDRRYYRRLPAPLRQRLLPALAGLVPPRPAKKGLVNKGKRFIEGGALPPGWGHTRWMSFLTTQERQALFAAELRRETAGRSPYAAIEAYFHQAAGWDPLRQQQYVDIRTYLTDNILVKVDRMSMAVSLEARVPLLDHRLVAFALGLPASLKLQGGETKRILRLAMRGILPDVVLDKPKQGFSVPMKHWLRGPLLPLMRETLAPEVVGDRGLFRPETVTRWQKEHLAGRINHSHRLWALMLLELWQRRLAGLPAAQTPATGVVSGLPAGGGN